ncbi:armadillo-type protein [Kockovaella imperatae]|uniref:Armadillo-type protein n=1 Tax=Kockovaella imperatae TaxID=4999 RepID=A0A1Y1UKC7_9TREE|nr:armadillo-type protein [Kockovaella imperatae]ORX38501.1 armadillo-type protein [Kockovaella imperatae]
MSTEHLLGDIGQVLLALMGVEDQPRQEAETHLRRLTVEGPGDVLLVLAQIGSLGVGGFQLDERLLSCILLCRMAFTNLPGLFLNDHHQNVCSPFDTIAERTKTRIENVLCAGLRDEMNVRMRKGLGNCTGKWAAESSLRQRPCMTIPPVILELTTSPHPFHRFTPFQLLHSTPTLLVDSVSDPLPIEQVGGLLVGGLNDSSVDVRVEALKAMCSLLKEAVTGKEREIIGSTLVGQAFEALPKLPTELLSHALLPLVDLSCHYPNLFIPSFPTILPYLLSLMAPPSSALPNHPFFHCQPAQMSYDQWEEIANPATEILLSLCEFRKAQVLAWENGRAAREMVGLLMARLVVGLSDQGEDCLDWLEETDLDEEDESYPAYPEECLDRLAETIDGTCLLPAVSDQVQPLVRHGDWRCRYTACVTIASVAEGCIEEIRPRLPDVLSLISPLAKDSHPRVRYGFLQCLGQLCSDLEGLVQAAYPKAVLDICLELLKDPMHRVQTHAAACLCNFIDQADLEVFVPHLDRIMGVLLPNLNIGPPYVGEQILKTIAIISSITKEAFANWYRGVMDILLDLLSADLGDNLRKTQAKAVECASSIGLAAGKTVFAADAVRLAEIMISIQNDCKEPDDPRSGYLMEGWANLARALGKDFAPFLPHVIPPLLKAAQYKPVNREQKLSLMSEDDGDDAMLSSTHHSELDEKILAFDNLTVYAHTMRGHFEPWLSSCMATTLEALSFGFSEDVREAAAFLVPALLQVAKDARSWQEQPYHLEHVFKTVINAMSKEVDFGYLALLYKSFTDSLHVIATPLPPTLLNHLLRETSAHLTDLHGRREDRQVLETQMDEGDRELFLEEQVDEDGCLDHMAKCLDMVIQIGGLERGDQHRIGEIMRSCGQVRDEGLKG